MTDDRFRYRVDAGLSATLDFSPIDDLLACATEGYRLFELFRLEEPEDLSHYIDAVVESSHPERFSWWPAGCRSEDGASRLSRPVAEDFWFPGPSEAVIRRAVSEAAQRWPDVEMAREAAAASPDPLVRTELALIAAGEHPNDVLLRGMKDKKGLTRHFRHGAQRRFPPAIYTLVEKLLEHPAVGAYTQRGIGDLHLLKLACREQHRRGGTSSILDENPFPVRILGRRGGPAFEPDTGEVLSLDPYPAWAGKVRWQFEGLRPQGLFFDEGGFGGSTHAQMESRESLEAVPVIVSTHSAGIRSPLRAWSLHDEYWVGLSNLVDRSSPELGRLV